MGGHRRAVVETAQTKGAFGTIVPSTERIKDLCVDLYFPSYAEAAQFRAEVGRLTTLHRTLAVTLVVEKSPSQLPVGCARVEDYCKLDDSIEEETAESTSATSAAEGKHLPNISAPALRDHAEVVHWVPKAYSPAFSGKKGALEPWFAVLAPNQFNTLTDGVHSWVPEVCASVGHSRPLDKVQVEVTLHIQCRGKTEYCAMRTVLNVVGEIGDLTLRLAPFVLSPEDAARLGDVLEWRSTLTELAREAHRVGALGAPNKRSADDRPPWYLLDVDPPECISMRMESRKHPQRMEAPALEPPPRAAAESEDLE